MVFAAPILMLQAALIAATSSSAPSRSEVSRGERYLPIRDRWRIGYTGTIWDPYDQNPLKGDYPIIGDDVFLVLTLVSDSVLEGRALPTPQGASRATPGSDGDFFGGDQQLFFTQNLIASVELFQGSTAFRPKDWSIRATPVVNLNELVVQENGIVNIDVRRRTTRFDHQIALQEAFAEARILDLDKSFDFISVRAGIQGFTSDFRGFIFSDNEPGLRLFGNIDNNRWQWNLAYFYLLEKDTNSGLNTYDFRHQHVMVANVYRQDFIIPGYTAQLSFTGTLDEAGSHDPGGQHYDTNGFLVRPALIGRQQPHDLRFFYLGWTGDGHIGRFNVTHAFYEALGTDDFNPIANQRVSINAQMAALELSYDMDWLRPRFDLFYGSGDSNPRDGNGNGFDSIFDNVNFAGAGGSFFTRQGLRLAETGLAIKNRFSLLADLRSSKDEGQSSFVNPGSFLVGPGLDLELTPKLRAFLNVNIMWFARTEPLTLILQQSGIRHYFGEDYSIRLQYRPFLSNNVIASAGLALFRPGGGFIDVQIGALLFSSFVSLTLTY
jgi:hypothetical protein